MLKNISQPWRTAPYDSVYQRAVNEYNLCQRTHNLSQHTRRVGENSHTSAYADAIHHSVTGPLLMWWVSEHGHLRPFSYGIK